MKFSDQALMAAERIAEGRGILVVIDNVPMWVIDEYWSLFTNMSEKAFLPYERFSEEEKVIALCLYATILQDEGK